MNALIIFAKVPELGKVKTRLAHAIGDEKTLEVYKEFLQTLIAAHKDKAYELIIYFTPAEKKAEMQKYYHAVKPSDGKNLGESLFNCFKAELATHDNVLVIGSDHPTITEQDVKDAFALLDTHDIVIGPAEDGGYYLVGMQQLHNIFENIAWSTDQALEQSLARCSELGLSVGLLREQYDVDTVGDLERYRKSLNR